MRTKPRGDLGVAFQAFQRGLASELVTTRAISGSVQRLMGARQGTGRNLGVAYPRE